MLQESRRENKVELVVRKRQPERVASDEVPGPPDRRHVPCGLAQAARGLIDPVNMQTFPGQQGGQFR